MDLVKTADVVARVSSLNYELPEFVIRDEALGGIPVVAKAFETPVHQADSQDDLVLKRLCEVSVDLISAEPALLQLVFDSASSAGFGSLLDVLAQYSAGR